MVRQGQPRHEINQLEANFTVLDALEPGMVQGIFEALDRNALVMIYY